jgi:hypothetical protein
MKYIYFCMQVLLNTCVKKYVSRLLLFCYYDAIYMFKIRGLPKWNPFAVLVVNWILYPECQHLTACHCSHSVADTSCTPSNDHVQLATFASSAANRFHASNHCMKIIILHVLKELYQDKGDSKCLMWFLIVQNTSDAKVHHTFSWKNVWSGCFGVWNSNMLVTGTLGSWCMCPLEWY